MKTQKIKCFFGYHGKYWGSAEKYDEIDISAHNIKICTCCHKSNMNAGEIRLIVAMERAKENPTPLNINRIIGAVFS